MPALVRHPHAALLEPTQLLLQLANKHSKYQLLQAIQKPCRPWSDIHMLLCWNLHSSCFNWQINTEISVIAGHPETMPALVRHPHAALLEPTQLLLQLANKHSKYQLLQAIQKPCRPWSDIHMLLCWNLHSSCFNWQINTANISYCRPSRNHAGPGPTSACCSAGTYTAPASTGK